MPARKPTAMVHLKLRFREELRRQVEESAKSRELSLNGEIIRRLEDSFENDNWREERERLALMFRTMGVPPAFKKIADELEIQMETRVQNEVFPKPKKKRRQ
jgi:Arc-like DNA binding domain